MTSIDGLDPDTVCNVQYWLQLEVGMETSVKPFRQHFPKEVQYMCANIDAAFLHCHSAI